MAEPINLEVRGAGPRGRGSSRGVSKRETPPRRTTIHEDGLHVGTIIEYVDDTGNGLGFCVWCTAGGGDRTTTYHAALDAVRTDLLR